MVRPVYGCGLEYGCSSGCDSSDDAPRGAPIGDGVIGNTSGSGPLIGGSSPPLRTGLTGVSARVEVTCEALGSLGSHPGPHRLVAQDTTLSRWRHGFESRWGYCWKPAEFGGFRRCGIRVVLITLLKIPRKSRGSRRRGWPAPGSVDSQLAPSTHRMPADPGRITPSSGAEVAL